jgi:hypothetical protein
MSKDTLRYTLTEVATEVLGRDAAYHGPYSAKLKDGTRVYRLTGSCPGVMGGCLFKQDGKVWLRKERDGHAGELVHITREIAEGNYQRDDLHFWRWE